ncbi:MAG: hypothetical protein K2X01_05120 [Cyanobacteria bacterium]|nr:hypothetical protein [Cyanobacteriota bacterium]
MENPFKHRFMIGNVSLLEIGMVLGFIALMLKVIAPGCENKDKKHADLEFTKNAEARSIEGMVNALNGGYASYTSAGNTSATGFYDFVRDKAGPLEGKQTISVAQFGTVWAKHPCVITTVNKITCAGSFRFFNPVVYNFNGGAISVDKTELDMNTIQITE